jgi:ubiquinol-cytochrome c reductase cytochrome b subunit
MIGRRIVRKVGEGSLRKADERLGVAKVAKSTLRKIFPDHWSFMLGEISLYSFVVLVMTGTYLTLFFDPSSSLRVYTGSYAPLHGQELSSAYASTVELSWDVRGGLLFRQVHHWAAMIFIGAIALHLCRIYFTGMFRKPRELNWTIGVTLLLLSIVTSFAGYSLPDDLLSGTGLHIFYSVLEGVPFLGSWLAFLAFGQGFPGTHIIPRLYALHVFVIPALLAVLISAHLAILIRQKHSQFPGKGRRDSNVVGSRMWPAYGLRSMALLFTVIGVCFLIGGLAQINPIWVWGDFKSSAILSPSVADWYIAWIEGALRLFPRLEFHLFGEIVPNQFWAAVLMPGLTFALLYAWPFIDRRLTGDRGTHHLTGRPRESPVRVGIGVGAITFYSVLLVAAGEEEISGLTQAPLGTVRAVLRVLVLVLPLVTGWTGWMLARSLRHSDKESLLELERADLRLIRPRRKRSDADAAPEAAVDTSNEVDDEAVNDAVNEAVPPAGIGTRTERQLSETPVWLGKADEP